MIRIRDFIGWKTSIVPVRRQVLLSPAWGRVNTRHALIILRRNGVKTFVVFGIFGKTQNLIENRNPARCLTSPNW